MSSVHRASVIGLGRQGQRHLDALAQCANVEIAAVCDVHQETLAQTLDAWPSAKGYTDYREMLQAEELDVLNIVTCAPLHAEITVAAAEAGLSHILCEKPMATSMAEADLMIDVCKQHDVRLAVNHCRRWWSAYHQLCKSLTDGSLGHVRQVHLAVGGGRLGCNGGHLFDLLRILIDSEAVEVVGVLDEDYVPDPRGIEYEDPGGFGQIIFANGARATIDMSGDLGIPPLWTITCSDGRVLIDELEDVWTVCSRDRSYQNEPAHARYGIPLQAVDHQAGALDLVQLTQMAVEELLAGGSISCSGEDGRAALEMTVGIHVSDKAKHAPVQLPLTGSDRQLKLRIP